MFEWIQVYKIVTSSMYLQYAVLLLVVLATTAWPPPNDGGWATVTDQVFPPTVAMPIRPSALVDWNNDEFIDLIGIGNGDSNQGASTLMIYEWQTSNNSFALSYTSEARTLPGGYPDPISNVVAADMNRDGRNDIVLLTASGALWIWDGASNNMSLVGNTSLPADVIQGSSPQLSVLSVYGVCALLDIVVTTSSGDLYVLQNDASGASCDFVGGPVSFTPHRIAGNVAPLSVLVADIYGTCNSELIFGVLPTAGSDVMTYYRFDSVGGQMVQLFEVPQYAGLPVAMDVNADGAVDFVFPYCTSTDTACRNGNSDFSAMLFVYSNMVGQACGAYDCCTGFGASFASVTSGVDDGAGFTVIAIQGMYEGLTSLTRSSATNAAATLPLVIRAGDYNRDSYPDFVIATNAGAALFSRVNGGLTPPQFAVQLFDPTSTDGIPFFFDLEEDGRLDVLVVHPSSTDVGLGLSAYWNGMTMHENYFLTAVILNGVNVGEATVDRPAPPGVNFPARGTTQVGSVHRFQWQDIETNLRTQGYTQQGSTQAHALGNPRVHFGLGRTFSYIQNYAAGIHIAQSAVSLHNTWPSYLIPNSQVVVIPYPLDDPSNWMIKLFLSSSKYQTLLIISLSTALAVIGVPIVILKYREMREDLAEMKRHA